MRSYQKFKNFFYFFLIFQNLIFFEVLFGSNNNEISKIEGNNINNKELLKKDSFNKYPIDYAKENNNKNIVNILSRAFKTHTIKRK